MSATPEPGTTVRLVARKWPARPHWEFEAVLLGSDEHGDWVGVPVGTRMARPGAEFVAPVHQVVLVPAREPDGERPGHLATFYAPGTPVDVYVDIATPAQWSGPVLTSVDLDLDVVRSSHGRVWVDDEDEFADHRVRFAYPGHLVDHAVRSCERVRLLVTTASAPFDAATPARWLARVGPRRSPRAGPAGRA